LGVIEALRRVQLLLDSRALELIDDWDVFPDVAECKCRFPISIGGCHVLAAAKRFSLKPVFMWKEREIGRIEAGVVKWLGSSIHYLSWWKRDLEELEASSWMDRGR
jgi:hypothetical protein